MGSTMTPATEVEARVGSALWHLRLDPGQREVAFTIHHEEEG